MRPVALRCLVLVAAAVTAALAVGCGSASETTSRATLIPPAELTNGPGGTATAPPTSGSRPGTAPCSAVALLDGIAAADPTVAAVDPFTCDGQWASATSASGTRFLLEANGPRWSVVDPATVCPTASIPAGIRSSACSSG